MQNKHDFYNFLNKHKYFYFIFLFKMMIQTKLGDAVVAIQN